MHYTIQNLTPRSDISLGRWGFSVLLAPEFKQAVARSGLDNEKARTAIENLGRDWLDGCGYDTLIEYDGKKEPLYKPHTSIRVDWGEWGPEHITVPGNACGLDLGSGIGAPPGGACLHPHNVDSMSQAMLLLTVFTWFAELIYIFSQPT